ncbi:hypothetical protein ONS95_005249 [Cadophora gregata]|uniref:uncharacterized protein n=1 Tax=Cadophora gregata TaxID=51156 RepID=UPI0026DA7CD6|nr:uncharacterized protein ONS95_005249 [Cadophora gregata]KAK0103215.1 hypothetical protein ONS95_005249 [Cadophora gregata]KAK0107402.1 hypothetical protein ONS96_003221 [Cadophora gregata f. sp. sojae]
MHLNRVERALPDGTCDAGKVFYNCQVNSFRGCCSVDPCALPACPDASSSTTAAISKTTSQPTTRQTLISIPNSLLTSAPATTTNRPTSIIVDIAVTSSTPTYTETEAQTQTASSTSPSTPSSSRSGVPNTPIIAGTISGVVFLSILSVLIWFCLRRRKQKQETRNSIAKYGLPTKEFVLDRPTPSESSRVGGDVFLPFGGRYDQPRLTSATQTPPPRSTQSTPIQAPTSSREIYPAAAAGYGSGNPDPTTPVTDRALPDPEKSTLTPPPVHEHPFFHPLPGQSAEIPTYHPGTPVHTNLTPIAPQKSTMRSHPTYHISQLSTHPAFRASKPPSPPRESGFPRRTSEVRQYRSLSPIQSNPRQQPPQNHNPTQVYKPTHENQNQNHNQQSWQHSELSAATATSPIIGRSELEADVPSTYLTPATTYNSPSDFDYTNKWTDRRSQITPISRGNTDSSKYSIPIGLGVDAMSQSYHSQGNGNEIQSSHPNPNSRPQHHHELETPSPAPATNQTRIPSLSITTSTSNSVQMLGPLGPNLNSPRDGGHIMSWADSYSNSRSSNPNLNLNPSSTHTTSRSQSHPQLRTGGGNAGSTSFEKEVAVVSPMTPERWSGATAIGMQSPVDGGSNNGTGRAFRGGETPLSAESGSACCSAGLSPEAGTGTWGSWSGR